MKIGKLLLFVIVLTSICFASPARIGYTGTAPVTDGSHTLTFKVYDTPTGGSPIWMEVHRDVEIIGSRYDVILGRISRLPSDDDGDYYIEVVYDETTVTDRRPFSMEVTTFASSADEIPTDILSPMDEMSYGLQIGDDAEVENVLVWGDLGVGIGTSADPVERIEVNGNVQANSLIDGDDVTYVVDPAATSNVATIQAEHYRDSAGEDLINVGEGLAVEEDADGSWTIAFAEDEPTSRTWTFDYDLEDWTSNYNCGYSSYQWVWNSDGGRGTAFAVDPSTHSSQTFTSPVVPLSGATVTLSYVHRHVTESCCDHGYVAYRLDGGAWTQFVPSTGSYNGTDGEYNDPILTSCAYPTIPLYYGSRAYQTHSGTITTSGASSIQIVFVFTSDASVSSTGWYIDEVTLDGIGGTSDSDGDWNGAGTGTMVAANTTDNVGIGTTAVTGRLDVRGDEVRFWDGSASVGYATGTGDLFVEDALEVDGTIYGASYRDMSGGNLINGGDGVSVSEDSDGSWTVSLGGGIPENILVFDGNCGSAPWSTPYAYALDDLGWTYTGCTDASTFYSYLIDGTDWDLVIHNTYSSSPSDACMQAMADHLADGGALIYADWTSRTGTGATALYAELDITGRSTFGTDIPIYRWISTHDLYNTPNVIGATLTPSYDPCGLEGMRLTVGTGATAVAGFSSYVTTGQAAVVVNSTGKGIFMGEVPFTFPSATLVDFLVNQIVYVSGGLGGSGTGWDYTDSDGDLGEVGQVLAATGTGVDWVDCDCGGGSGDYCSGELDIDGSSTTTWMYPLRAYYHDSRTTSIYLAEEFGCDDGGTIEGIQYYVSTVPGQTLYNFRIRMRHTSEDFYPSSDPFDNTGWTVCYNGTFPIGSTGWRTISFTAPFVYNGTDNLEIDVSFDNTSYTSNGMCYYFTGTGARSKYNYYDSSAGSPLTWTTAYTATNVPRVRFNFEETGGVEVVGCATPACGTLDRGELIPTLTHQDADYTAATNPYWHFAAEAGETYNFSMCGNTEDTYLRIYSSECTEIASNDDAGPHCSGTPASLAWTCTADGNYTVSPNHYTCSNFSSAGSMEYWISAPPVVGCASPGCGTLERGELTPTTTHQYASYTSGTNPYWHFAAESGETYNYSLCGSTEDTYLRIYNSSCTVVASNDDGGPHCSGAPASLEWDCTTDGNYTVSPNHYSCSNFTSSGSMEYWLSSPPVVGCASPDCGTLDRGSLTPTTSHQYASYTSGTNPYWHYAATAGRHYNFSLCGSTEDTYMRIYNSSCTVVASNDDAGPHCSGVASSLDYTCPTTSNYTVSPNHYTCSNFTSSGSMEYWWSSTAARELESDYSEESFEESDAEFLRDYGTDATEAGICHVDFPDHYVRTLRGSVPSVMLTPMGDASMYVENVTTTGFDARISDFTEDIMFNWMALTRNPNSASSKARLTSVKDDFYANAASKTYEQWQSEFERNGLTFNFTEEDYENAIANTFTRSYEPKSRDEYYVVLHELKDALYSAPESKTYEQWQETFEARGIEFLLTREDFNDVIRISNTSDEPQTREEYHALLHELKNELYSNPDSKSYDQWREEFRAHGLDLMLSEDEFDHIGEEWTAEIEEVGLSDGELNMNNNFKANPSSNSYSGWQSLFRSAGYEFRVSESEYNELTGVKTTEPEMTKPGTSYTPKSSSHSSSSVPTEKKEEPKQKFDKDTNELY